MRLPVRHSVLYGVFGRYFPSIVVFCWSLVVQGFNIHCVLFLTVTFICRWISFFPPGTGYNYSFLEDLDPGLTCCKCLHVQLSQHHLPQCKQKLSCRHSGDEFWESFQSDRISLNNQRVRNCSFTANFNRWVLWWGNSKVGMILSSTTLGVEFRLLLMFTPKNSSSWNKRTEFTRSVY